MKLDTFIQDNYSEYINDIQQWVDHQYDTAFKSCFDAVNEIHKNMQTQSRQITDTELEWTLTELPMQLFSISENLNKLRLDYEVIKLRKKAIKVEFDKKAAEMVKDSKLAKSEVKSWVDAELVDHDILIAAYNSLITRVESEISFSRELIMGCKKIWDARRKTENVNPVSEVTPETLPKYHSPQRYHESYR